MLRVLVDLSSALGGVGLVRIVRILGRSHALGLGGGVAVKSLFWLSHGFWLATGIYSIGLRCRVGRTSGKDWGWT